MRCPKCNKVIKKTDSTCKFCNATLQPSSIIKTQVVVKTVENKANKWIVLGIGVLAFIVLLETSFIIWYFFIKEPLNDTKYKIESYNYSMELPYETSAVGEDILFDNLIINISKKYEILTLDNNYSIYNGKKVIKIPVKITNKSDKNHSLNLFNYYIYDDYGNNIDEVAGYYDESLYYAEDLKKDESYIKYIYALYYGNDSYIIRFSNKEKTINIKYTIKK